MNSARPEGLRPRSLLSVAAAVAIAITGVTISAAIPVAVAQAGAATEWAVSASFSPAQADLLDIACPSALDCFAVGFDNGGAGTNDFNGAVIKATTDGGQTWASQPVPSLAASGNGSGLEAIACTSTSRCFADGVANGGGVILGTTDAGATWSVVWSVQQAPDLYVSGGMPAIACPSSTECFALGDSGTAGYATKLLTTTDGGSSWTSHPLPADLPQLNGIDCQSVTRCILVGGADIVETTDSGSSWVVQDVGNSVAFSLMSVDCPSSTTCYAAGGSGSQGSATGGVVFATTDSGTSWTGQSVPIANVNKLTCTSTTDCFGGGSQGYAGEMIGTWNGGGSWFVQALPLTTGAIWGLSCPSSTDCLSTEAGGWSSQNSLILQGPGVGTSSTTTTVSVSAPSSAAGQTLTYSATVTGVPGTSPPTGTVAFAAGATPLCVATLVGGTGSCISGEAPVGPDDVSGSYSGDNTFFSSSGAASLEVGLSTTSIAASPSNALPGQVVTYSADVTPQVGTGIPTGTVAFVTGTTPLCVATLVGGAGSCTANNAPAGTQSVLGSYSGGASFQASSGSTGLDVGLTSVTEVSVSSPTTPPNQPVTYSADVTAGTGTGTPTGTVDFTAGTTQLCVAVLSGGSGSCAASNAPMGTNTVVGTYSGDSSYTGSSGTAALFVQSQSLTTVSVNAPTVGLGQDVTYSATVRADVGTAVPTGTVAFTVGTTDLCVATLAGGTGSCVAGTAPVGIDLVVGTYSGDSDVIGSFGNAVLTVGPTTTTVSATPSPVSTTQPVTYSASVVADVGSGTPTGTVTFTIGSTDLCVATLVGGTGSCVASLDPVGVNQVSGWYSGDSDDAGSSGTTQLAVGPTTTTISMSSPSVAADASVTYSATVTSAFGVPTGTVTFSVPTQSLCTATLVDGQGSCVSPDAPIGTADVVTGAYSGDSNDFGSIGSATLTVAKFPSQTVYSSTATFGQNVWFTGIATSAGPVTGAITFSIGAMVLCTATLTAPEYGTCLDSEVPLGTYTVTATYSGNSSVAGSSFSQVFSLVRETAVAVSVNPAPATEGHEELYSATVTAPAGGTPTGTVSLSIGSTVLCVATLVGGTGSCTTNDAPEGIATVTGVYSGDSAFAGSVGSTGIDVKSATTTTPPLPTPGGYDLVGADGGVFVFGGGFYGSLPGLGLHVDDITGIVGTSAKHGYFLVGADGGVFSFNAPFANSLPGIEIHLDDIVGIVPTRNDQGYFLVGRDGGVFSFNAPFENSLPGIGIHLDDIVGIAATADDNGYWLVGSNGEVYAFGDAHYEGNAPSGAVAITATRDGRGYWVVGANGSVHAFGDAVNFGDLPGLGVRVDNIVGIVVSSDSGGYNLIGDDGGVFSFGDARNNGSLPALKISVDNIVGAVPT